MAFGDIETFQRDGKWHVRIEGSQSLLGTFETRREAVDAGELEALERAADHIVRDDSSHAGRGSG